MLLVVGCSKTSPPPEPVGAPEPASVDLVITAEITKVSQVPDPSSVPYKDCLTYLKYKVISVDQGTYDQPELLAVHQGMKDGKLAPAASFRVGAKQTLTLEPFSDHPELARVMQADDTEEFELTPYWVVAVQ